MAMVEILVKQKIKRIEQVRLADQEHILFERQDVKDNLHLD
jgi:hypothetical protein